MHIKNYFQKKKEELGNVVNGVLVVAEALQEYKENPSLQKSSQFLESKPQEKQNCYLMEENCLVISPSLACVIGINSAIILQQVHYFVMKNQNRPGAKSYYFRGQYWTWINLADWQQQLPFLSVSTIKRLLYSLVHESRILIRRQTRRDGIPKTYYCVDYERLAFFVNVYQPKPYQKDIMHIVKYNSELHVIEDC